MSALTIEGLRLENWLQVSDEQRLQSLQDLETLLAAQENRKACKVELTSKCQELSPEERETTRGLHTGDHIYIKDELVNGTETPPYLATETLFHESRHAYQEHAAVNPPADEDPDQVRDWQMNVPKDGYLSAQKFGYAFYRWQPIEKDANEVAHQRTEQLYHGEFNDTSSSYTKYQGIMQAELNEDEALGSLFAANPPLASNYAEMAREKMIAQYQANQAQNQAEGASEAQSSPAGEKTGKSVGEGLKQDRDKAAGPAGRDATGNAGGEPLEGPDESVDLPTHAPVESADRTTKGNTSEAAPESAEDYDYYQGYGH